MIFKEIAKHNVCRIDDKSILKIGEDTGINSQGIFVNIPGDTCIQNVILTKTHVKFRQLNDWETFDYEGNRYIKVNQVMAYNTDLNRLQAFSPEQQWIYLS